MANEKALFIVIGINKPARDPLCGIAANFARLRMENVHAFHLHTHLAVPGRDNVDVGFAEYHKQIALACGLELARHVEVGVHARLENWDSSELVELRGMGLIVESAGNQYVEVGVACLASGGNQIGAGDGTELRADENGSAFFGAGLRIAL